MGAAEAAAQTILPLQGNGKRHTPDPCISLVSEPSVGAQVYLQFATICCKSNILFFFEKMRIVHLLLCLHKGTYAKFGQGVTEKVSTDLQEFVEDDHCQL